MRQKPTSLEIEGKLEDALEAQQEADCNQDYSSTGMCPCCGVELEIFTEEYWSGTYGNVYCEETQQTCPSCGWSSLPAYDSE